MIEYTVHFQRGTRVGTRSKRMEYVTAASIHEAVRAAKVQFPEWSAERYRVVRVDHFEGSRVVVDFE